MYFSGVSEHPCEQLASPVLMLSIKNDLDWVFVYFFHKSSFLCGIQGKDYASLSGGLLVQGPSLLEKTRPPTRVAVQSKPEISWKPWALQVLAA